MRTKKAQRDKKRIFGACILFMTVVLTLVTVALAEDPSSSYYLTIQKVFDPQTSEDVKAAAKDQTYTFRVQAQVKSGGEYESEEKVVHIRGEGKAIVEFGNAFKVSVIEQTSGEGFEVTNGPNKPFQYNVSDTVCVSKMHVGASSATVHISKDNGEIKITRPEDVPTVTFRLTGKPLHGTQEEFDQKLTNLNLVNPVPVSAGETKGFSGLPQGEYTITKLRAADGFSVLVGSREFDVGADQTGQVYINGSDSKITITAPDVAEDGIVRTHHYRVSGGNTYMTREIDVSSGQQGTVEHLAEGLYTIGVSETYDGIKGYTVKYPSSTTVAKTVEVNQVTTSDKRSYRGYSVGNADQVELYGFGPLYDASGKKITSKVTYQVNWGIHDGSGVVRNNTAKSERSGSGLFTLNTPRRLVPTNGYLYFAITGVSDPNVKKIDVRWREYREKEETREITKPLPGGNVVEVDGLTDNYIIIDKPEDETSRGGEVKYYYAIQDSNGNLITDPTVTDEDGNAIDVLTNETFNGKGTTVTLQAGQTVKINGLKSGANYRIYEYVEKAHAMSFHVKLEDTRRSVTTPGGEIEITTLDARTVEIRRPGDPNDDNGRVYTYKIYKDGVDKELRTIQLKSGDTTTVAEATGSMLPAGTYRIKAVDDQIVGFDVAFTDSSSLTSDYIRTADVTFTNSFAPVEASYHVIHEYYLKDGDSYSFEGASPVYTKNCDHQHAEGQGHTSQEVHLLDVFHGNTYTHFNDAYGNVVSWEKDGGTPTEAGVEGGEKIDLSFAPAGGGLYNRKASNGMGTAEDPGTRDYDYVPIADRTCAMATAHGQDGSHSHGAQIIILRYYREKDTLKTGKYNIIHVYYKRTSDGDELEGRSPLITKDVGILNDENRWTPYDASGVEKIAQPGTTDWETWQDNTRIYQYDGAVYGRVLESHDADSGFNDTVVEDGKVYRKDDTMDKVYATEEGDQIIVLRYYRIGGYNVVHEYYFREEADTVEDPDASGEDPGGDGGEESEPEGQGIALQAEDSDTESSDASGTFQGTLTYSDGYTYDYEGKSDISTVPSAIGVWRDVDGDDDHEAIDRQEQFRPEGQSQRFTYTYKDAVYGYLDKNTGTYRAAPYKTGVTANDQSDEIIILRYYRDLTGTQKAHYHVVHEYYKRTRGDEDGVMAASLEDGLEETEEMPKETKPAEETDEVETPGIQEETSEQETTRPQDPSGEDGVDQERPSDEQGSSGAEDPSGTEGADEKDPSSTEESGEEGTSGTEGSGEKDPSGTGEPDEKGTSGTEDLDEEDPRGPTESSGQKPAETEGSSDQGSSMTDGSGDQDLEKGGSAEQDPPAQQMTSGSVERPEQQEQAEIESVKASKTGTLQGNALQILSMMSIEPKNRLVPDARMAALAVSMMHFSTESELDLEDVSDILNTPMASGLEDEVTDAIDDTGTSDDKEGDIPFSSDESNGKGGLADESDPIDGDGLTDKDDVKRPSVDGNVEMDTPGDEDDDSGIADSEMTADEKTDGEKIDNEQIGGEATDSEKVGSVKNTSGMTDDEKIDSVEIGSEMADDDVSTSSNARRKANKSGAADASVKVGDRDGINKDGWVYTYEGRSEILTINAPADSEHYTNDVGLQTRYQNREYVHDTSQLEDGYGDISAENEQEYAEDEHKTVVVSRQEGDQIIILRYYRDASDPDEPDTPDKPDEPDPTPPPPGGGGGRHHRDPDPDPTPSSTTAPDPTSEQPTETMGENPGYPTELPDPNDPNSPARITIWEDGVPKTYVKVWNPETGMWEYILEEEVPLSWQDLPQTGDKSRNVLWMVLFISSIVGIIWLIAVRRKERS